MIDLVLKICQAIQTAGWILNALIFVRILLSWLRIGANNPVTQFVYNMTELFLSPIRRLIAKSPFGGPGMMLDFSPLIAVLLIDIVTQVLINLIQGFLI